MGQRDFTSSQNYLDTLSLFYQLLPEKDYFILNAQSVFYDLVGDSERALEREKEKLNIFNIQNEKIELSRVYFNISNIYVGLEQLDSAMYYAEKSIDLIPDTDYRQNYLYYHNLSQIAEKQGDYKVSNEYLKQAMEMHNRSLRERLDLQIAELEKIYDLSEAENEVLRARDQISKTIIIALIIVLILVFISMYAVWNRRNTQLKLLQAEHLMNQQQLQTEILNEEAAKRKWLLHLYGNISDRLTFLQTEFEQLSQRYVTSNKKIYQDMRHILKNTDTDLRDITKTLAPDDETFYAYTRLNNDDDFFSMNEKLLLMLLACDADNRQLATFMNTSVDSIRVRKSQLKKKMAEKGINTTIFSEM
jgi:tetratricopeptide (TPR) repeat protein